MCGLKTFLTIIFFQAAFYCFGQGYDPFPVDSARWVEFASMSYEEGALDNAAYYISFYNDTLVNGIEYKNLGLTKIWSFGYNPYSEYANNYDSFEEILGCIRENDRKIFFYKYLNEFETSDPFSLLLSDMPDTTEITLYDFNFIEGDTIENILSNTGFPLIFNSVDSVLLNNGEYRRKYEIQYFTDEFSSEYRNWVEGIGDSESGIFSNYFLHMEGPSVNLTCFWKAGEYLIGDDSCDYSQITEIENIIEHDLFLIYPNPVIDFVNIVNINPGKTYAVKIFDVFGKMIKSNSIINPYISINLADLKSGIYFLSIEKNGIQIQTEKLIKY